MSSAFEFRIQEYPDDLFGFFYRYEPRADAHDICIIVPARQAGQQSEAGEQ